MKRMVLIFLSLFILFGASIALAQNTLAADIEATNPTILPTNPVYFLKTFGRNIQMALTFDPVKKAELRLNIAEQKLAEANKVAEKNPNNNNAVQKALENYKKETEALLKQVSNLKKDSEKAQKLLEKVTEQNFAHQEVLEQIENKVQNKEKVQEVKDKALENFVNTSFEVASSEKIQEKLEASLNSDQAGKKLEVINKMQEISSEERKKELLKIEDNIISAKLQNQDLNQSQKQQLEQLAARIKETPEYKQIFSEEFAKKLLNENQSLQNLNNISVEDMAKIQEFAKEILNEKDVDYEQAIKKFNTLDLSSDTKKIIEDGQKEILDKLNPEDIVCVEVENPVCGKDGQTYGNICKAKKANVEVAYSGACGQCAKEGQAVPLTSAAENKLCCPGLTLCPVPANANGTAKGICRKTCETNKECFKEGETIPVIAESANWKCCEGLQLCPPKENILGIRGTCKKTCESVQE